MPRNYAREYARYHAKPAQKKNRAKRNAARRIMVRKHGKVKLRGKDIDHKRGVERGNSASNLRIQSKRANRSFKRNSKGRPIRRG